MATSGSVPPPITGESIVQLALRHIGESYVFGVLVPKNNPNWTKCWDCAEFVSWTVFQVAKVLYGCDRDNGDPATADAYTGYWERDAKSLGEIIPIEEAARTPGAAVLRVPQGHASGHIVISDGNGGCLATHSPPAAPLSFDRHWRLCEAVTLACPPPTIQHHLPTLPPPP